MTVQNLRLGGQNYCTRYADLVVANVFEPKDVAALAVFWLAGVVTCEGIFQVSKEGRAAVVLPAATHPYSLYLSLFFS